VGYPANKLVREGYIGKAKCLKQVLWERGLFHEYMIKDIPKNDKKAVTTPST
jgi:hypothetical protein